MLHYALSVTSPSLDLLDSLYFAGADLSLFTTNEEWTPLHVLAQNQKLDADDHAIYDLVVHLIRDLRAPLPALDKNDETCIHIAAERGVSFELLACLLDMDKTGGVRKLRNSRGYVLPLHSWACIEAHNSFLRLTAMQVAKPEFLSAFGPEAGILQLITPKSGRTSASPPNDSQVSLSELSERSTRVSHDDSASLCSPTEVDIALTSQRLLTNLRQSSPAGKHGNDPNHLHQLESLMADSRQYQESLVEYFRGKVREIERELEQLQKSTDKISHVRSSVAKAARTKSQARGVSILTPVHSRARESQDSTSTAISSHAPYDVSTNSSFTLDLSPVDGRPQPFDTLKLPKAKSTILSRSSLGALSSLFDRSGSRDNTLTVYNAHIDAGNTLEIKEQIKAFSSRLSSPSTPDLRRQLKEDKKRAKQQDASATQVVDKGKGSSGNTGTRLKAWLRKIVTSSNQDLAGSARATPTPPLPPLKTSLPVPQPIPSPRSPQPRPSTLQPPAIFLSAPEPVETMADPSIDAALKTSAVVLDAALRDIHSIRACLVSAQEFVNSANHSITKVERATKRALKVSFTVCIRNRVHLLTDTLPDISRCDEG